ncbi:DNA gyrase subunit A, partial [Xanthomonas citri pv. citri]|nr:DNA gyrase subunit A [Xanthomonas citri pv. citri]
VTEFNAELYLFFTTKHGVSKRTSLSQFANIRNNGLIALSLREDDELMGVRLTDGTKQIIIGTKNGLLIRFPETDVREMGRTAAGVKGIIVTEKGYGKRTPAEEYRTQSRGGKGLKTAKITENNGQLVAVKATKGEEDLMIITASGVLIRMDINDISITGRVTQGVRLI